MIYIGIDPGDRWCGVASLDTDAHDGGHVAQTHVYDAKNRSFSVLVDCVLNSRIYAGPAARVVIEQFRSRPVGHQSWNGGDTLQLVGAIRYIAEKNGVQVGYVPAGDPLKELPKYPIHRYIEHWRLDWPKPNDKRWHHGLSAWRVMAAYLMKHDPELLVAMKQRVLPTFSPGLPYHGRGPDLHSPPVYWLPTP